LRQNRKKMRVMKAFRFQTIALFLTIRIIDLLANLPLEIKFGIYIWSMRIIRVGV
jgi:hypothetical protein